MEVMLNMVDTLMEIGVHKNWQNTREDEPQPGSVDPLIEFGKDKDSKVYNLALCLSPGAKREMLFYYV